MLHTSYINKRNNFEIQEIWDYLQKYGVDFDNPEKTVVVRENGNIVGTGSIDGKVMKYFFIEPEHKGEGITSQIYNALLSYLFEKGELEHFLFTKPENDMIFGGIGLDKVLSTDKVSLFEGGFSSYSSWIKSVKIKLNPNANVRGAIVANCNPMTKGHKYLIDYAKEKIDELVVFIVEEDKSVFPTEDRYSIVSNEYKDDDKVVVVMGGPYIISQVTFPTYFIKKVDDSTEIFTELDAKIFAEKIAVDLDIDIRFVGNEPIDRLTAKYNQKLFRSTRDAKLEIEQIDRLKSDNDDIISASRVRKLISEDKLDEAFKVLPKSTIEYLKSDKGKKVISKLQYKGAEE